ncbi:unnamed protein product [Rhizophagus irregularis]|nr:unnamed protein product [Rhizophagus irregularis]
MSDLNIQSSSGEISEVTALSSRHLPFNIHHEAKILQKICQASNLKVQYRNILRRSLWTQSHFHITTEVNKFPPFGGQCGRYLKANFVQLELQEFIPSRIHPIKSINANLWKMMFHSVLSICRYKRNDALVRLSSFNETSRYIDQGMQIS